jgi:hypothetical protein
VSLSLCQFDNRLCQFTLFYRKKKPKSFLSISDIDEINITLFYLKKNQKFDKIDFFGYISDIDEIK